MIGRQRATKPPYPNRLRGLLPNGAPGIAAAILTGQAASGIGFVLLARRLAPAEFGAFVSLYALSLSVGGLIDFGGSTFITRELAREHGISTFNSWSLRRFVVAVPAACLLAAAFTMWQRQYLPFAATLFLAAQAATYVLYQNWSAAQRALGVPSEAAWAATAGNILTLCVIVVCPPNHLPVATALAMAVSWIVSAAIGRAAIRGALARPHERFTGHPWRGSAAFGLSATALALQGTHLAVVSVAAGSAEAGQAAAVWRWVAPIGLLATAFTTEYFPRLVRAPSAHDAIGLLRGYWRVLAVATAAVAVVSLGAAPLVHRFLGPDYAGAASVLRLQAVAALVSVLSRPLLVLLQARGKETPVARWLVATNVVAIPGIYLGAHALGAVGLPLVLLLAELVLLLGLGRNALALTSDSVPHP